MKKNVLIAACLVGFVFAATGAYAQNDAMSKDAMGRDEMTKDNEMKKGSMAKHDMKKKGAMSHDSMGKPMSDDKSNKMSH
ncbi:hypothetical protein WK09_06040 [Burkholderia ubonensis]|uniref:pentapeptide MXKDX repeat protein n=1 Tax=Burkholderia ubonensis TaxID=101571 RepID=UPI000756B0CA|nr:pentapeptide MXKDX repeat protein [Burkholderia ubonensis]KVQ97601.1 hypothetical protein WK09_06040 [Burkholderia ubonensis]